MGNLISKDGVGVNVGVNKEDLITTALVLIIVGVVTAVLSGLILRAI